MRGRRRVGVLQLERHLSLTARWTLLIGALSAIACDDAGGTEIVVVIDSVLDAEAGEYDRVDLEVSAGGTTETRCAVIGRDEDGCVRVDPRSRQSGGDFPLALSVVSASGRGQLLARVELSLAETVVACRALSAELEPGEPRMLRVEVGRPCGETDCSSAEVVELEPWIDMLPPSLVPQPASEAPELPIRGIAAGTQHACLIDGMNRLFCWGANDVGQLGTRDQTARYRPALVTGLTDIVDVDAGETHTCAVASSGEVNCWGGNDDGQVGNGGRARIVSRPVVATTGASAVSLGPWHSCAIVADGVQCWGSNANGESGGAENPVLDPTLVPGLPATIAHMSAGGGSTATAARHTCAIDDTGAAHCWGGNTTGQLGFEGADTSTAMPVTLTETLVDIAAGSTDTCAIATGGQVFCWGSNVPPGTLGFMASDATERRPPSRIDADTSATQIAAGDTYRCFVDTDQSVRCFGNELVYRLGQSPTRTPVTFVDPVLVPTPGALFTEVAVGGAFACALPSDGTMPWCWGDNAVGQLGQGTPGDPSLPVQIPLCN